MTDDVPPEVHCPDCGSSEVTTDRRYGVNLKRRELVRRVLRTPIFWIGIVLVGIGLFYPGIQWRAALAVLGIVLMMNAILNNEETAVDGSDASRYPWASHICRQCGYQWTSEKTQVTVAANDDQIANAPEDQLSAAGKTPASMVTIVGWVALVAGLLFLCCLVGVFLYVYFVGLPT